MQRRVSLQRQQHSYTRGIYFLAALSGIVESCCTGISMGFGKAFREKLSHPPPCSFGCQRADSTALDTDELHYYGKTR